MSTSEKIKVDDAKEKEMVDHQQVVLVTKEW